MRIKICGKNKNKNNTGKAFLISGHVLTRQQISVERTHVREPHWLFNQIISRAACVLKVRVVVVVVFVLAIVVVVYVVVDVIVDVVVVVVVEVVVVVVDGVAVGGAATFLVVVPPHAVHHPV